MSLPAPRLQLYRHFRIPMPDFSPYSLKFSNIKCFGQDPQGFETIKPINIIIGRNNSGKSTLVDLFPSLVKAPFAPAAKLSRLPESDPIAHLSFVLTPEMLSHEFTRQLNNSPYNHWQNAAIFANEQLIGKKATFRYEPDKTELVYESVEGDSAFMPRFRENENRMFREKLARCIQNPFRGFGFHRMDPERRLRPEIDQESKILDDGSGGTNEIQRFLNKDGLPPDLVTHRMLSILNDIIQPDAKFSQIVTRQIDNNGRWEVFLKEQSKGLIPLSRSGHGLQTVILVLVHTLLKVFPDGKLSRHIFAFEELENNLHPSLLRRLLEYIRMLATSWEGTFFITTHSHVAIDMFRMDDQAQIIHVTHDGDEARCRTLTTYLEHGSILDDLDVRASDILQANCVIWVEGPSDRILINRWIHLASKGGLREGFHYQCVFYGGRLLAHLSAEEPDFDDDAAVRILTLNRKACVMMDSDKDDASDEVGATKLRIQREIESVGGISWITDGREVENYIDPTVIQGVLKLESEPAISCFDEVYTRLDQIQEGLGTRERRRKPLFAERLAEALTRDNWDYLDLKTRISTLCEQIRIWNGERD